jgi:hypothetical protein
MTSSIVFFKWKPPIFFLDSDSPFNCLNDSIKILLPYIRKFLRKKKNKVGKNKFYNEQKQVKNCVSKYYRGHPKVNVFFYSLIFTLNHRRPKMSKFDTSDKKIIETIFFKCHISLRFRQLGLLQS